MSKKKKTIEELLEEAILLDEEQSYVVPRNWVWTRIENAIKPMETREPKKLDGEVFHYIDVDAIDNKKQSVRQVKEVEITLAPSRAKRKVSKDDVIISLVRPYLKNIAHIDIDDNKLVASTAFYVCTPKEILDSNYLYSYLCSNYATQYLIDHTRGDNSPSVRSTDYEKMPLPLPPVNEQKRIVEKVERLLSKIEEAKQLIEEAKETFELRRAAILDKAFRGELTRKWRGENADITTANEWIEQINLLKEGTKTKYKDQLDSSILEKLYKLPKEWKWVRLNDLIEASTYGTSAKTNDDVTGTPVLRMGNIVDGYLELNNLKYLPNNHEDVLKYDLQTNDLLFNRTNSYELVGKTSVITEDVSERFTFASYLIRVRLFYKDFLASYVSHYINSHVGRKILLSMVTQQVGQANINSQKLASLPIPLPSQEEVMEITNWLNNYRELESKQKEMILVEENIEALKQSILSKAFRGELGTNDPGEESAIELLKEVLQEQVK
ncbi:restriction endonuclease subunit S [Bacillus siamensis]|uniref:restriction endonuclease subunit S n=1 Tax=Bacillus siamensis TaxID=659243 RepID=UPI002E1C8B5E|nr:restriction endonuclease subunit S [Bacillus siamensis]MED0771645.1 restriction endonuclease subunit S [Bacillus siamensis]MED0777133.1 restriction endonuclease subunit S [Bacillus siamensis]MED0780233.1 restriction endonuclease subunit S [Bacillus siamensis]MED0833052.1 restriction endonuclease subunit S [Bacillus siamensis]